MTPALHNQRSGKRTSPLVEAVQKAVWGAAGEIGWPTDKWCHSLKGKHALIDQKKSINEPTGVSQIAVVSVSRCRPERPEGIMWRLQQAVASQSTPASGSQQSAEGLLSQSAHHVVPGASVFPEKGGVCGDILLGDQGVYCWLCYCLFCSS